MYSTKRIYSAVLVVVLLFTSLFTGFRFDREKTTGEDISVNTPLVFPAVKDIKVIDSFWGPKLKLWNDVTVNDVFNKFEGQYEAESRRDLLNDYKTLGRTRDAFRNFDMVAQGKRGTGQRQHDGPPWYDGLVYETDSIRTNSLWIRRVG